MAKKLNLGIVFGGVSVEHEVSLLSVRNVISALDRSLYELFLVGIDKEGGWALYDEEDYLVAPDNLEEIALSSKGRPFSFSQMQATLDVVFPVLHGTNGEDGTIQGVFKVLGIPFVGAGVLGSAIGMDKDVMKRLLRESGLAVAAFTTIRKADKWSVEEVLSAHSLPLFVKPANGGSSIGICKVKKKEELESAIAEAFQWDHKVIIEEAVVGREIEICITGDEDPIASLACEIIPKGEFHSYSSKYIDPKGAEFVYPAELELGIFLKVRATALKAYKVLCTEGMARVDLFLKPCGEVLVNEINTIPGLTNRSPFAKMWQLSGVGYPELLDRLIKLALERDVRDQEYLRRSKRVGALK